jgi:branched-chain amino acid transport system substrate-binding protein
MAPLGYDAVKILAAAIVRAGTADSAKIRDALATTKNFPGVTGRTTIDNQRNASKPAVVLTVKNGRAQFLQSIEP